MNVYLTESKLFVMKKYLMIAAVLFGTTAFTATTALAYTSTSIEISGEKEGKKKDKKKKSDKGESGKSGCSGKSEGKSGGCCAAKKKA
jgi:hypothetical protein